MLLRQATLPPDPSLLWELPFLGGRPRMQPGPRCPGRAQSKSSAVGAVPCAPARPSIGPDPQAHSSYTQNFPTETDWGTLSKIVTVVSGWRRVILRVWRIHGFLKKSRYNRHSITFGYTMSGFNIYI